MNTQQLYNEAMNAINDSWTYSMYWQKDEYGNPVLAGWQQAFEDALVQLSRLEGKCERLRKVMSKISKRIAEEKNTWRTKK